MRVWQKRVIGAAMMALSSICIYLFWPKSLPEGSIPAKDIVSYCVGDATGDGTLELLAISGEGEIDTGERHGDFLLVCEASAGDDMGRLGYIPPEKILHRIDLTGIKPMKVQLGDVNGDGVNEVAICVYKTARFHPVMAKRPFFFDLVEGNLIPIWLGSRLSRPFDDYILYDINVDGIDEIISIELLENGDRTVAAYRWRGFGFEILAQTEGLFGELCFEPAGQDTGAGEIGVILFEDKEPIDLKFRLDGERLIFK